MQQLMGSLETMSRVETVSLSQDSIFTGMVLVSNFEHRSTTLSSTTYVNLVVCWLELVSHYF